MSALKFRLSSGVSTFRTVCYSLRRVGKRPNFREIKCAQPGQEGVLSMFLLNKNAWFVLSLLTVVTWVVAAEVANSAEPILRLPTNHHTCFCCRAFTDTGYLVFRADGTFAHVSREHLGVILFDQGTWKQNCDGVIDLRSRLRLRSVQCGALSIRVERVDVFRALASLKADMTSFLAATKAASFSRKEIEKVWEYSYQPFPDSPELTSRFAAVTVAPSVESIPRRKLEELLAAWDAYLTDDEKNLRHATPITLQTGTFLVSQDDPLLRCASVADVKKSLDLWEADDIGSPYFVYVMIPYEQFLDEIKTPQPFLFPQGPPLDP